MKWNRLIYLAAIIGSSIFASYYGGNISYALFYLTLLIPVIAYLYTLYVYFRFKISQSMDSYLVVKGDWTPYSFIIANEDYITFRHVKVNFLSDKSIIEAAHQIIEYSLLPAESEKMQTRIKCNYRGEYYVGVDSIEVTDFLYLFSITYPISSKLKARVLPRVVPLEQLGIAPAQEDVKNPVFFSDNAEEELDTELRNYYPGDSRKQVHWKATAKMQKLISRKYQHIPKTKIVLFMDLFKIEEDELKVTIAEDKIMESILAIANFYALRGTTSKIIYEMGGTKEVTIHTKRDFEAFYKTCAVIYFQGRIPVSELLREKMLDKEEGLFCVIATHFLTNELYQAAMQLLAGGNHICLLLASDDISQMSREFIASMKKSGIDVHQIMAEDEIQDVLA